jgi:glycolate oxidase iron-sulfur subunit
VNELKIRITYHDPCHLKRGLHIWEEPRRLLRSLPGVELVEMEDADRCCGGMAFSANMGLAERLSAQKASNIIATEAEAVVTACPTCQDMIRKALMRGRCSIPVYVLEDMLNMALAGQ